MPVHAYDYAILRAVPRVERGEHDLVVVASRGDRDPRLGLLVLALTLIPFWTVVALFLGGWL